MDESDPIEVSYLKKVVLIPFVGVCDIKGIPLIDSMS
jgi:hypothetical protein